MMNITGKRIYRFNEKLAKSTDVEISFVDVGSGGPLKEPWVFIPEKNIKKYSFEPTEKPVCISNRVGEGAFYVVDDERASSLHKPASSFVDRFDFSMQIKESLNVELKTLDSLFDKENIFVDGLDINAEGHDFQVLEGSKQLLSSHSIKLLKIEFELTNVWDGQGWFSDIDSFLRGYDYDLINFDVEYSRPKKVKDIPHRGEPLWGKAYYAPSQDIWKEILTQDATAFNKGVMLYAAADAPGRAFDLIDLANEFELHAGDDAARLKSEIKEIYRYAKLDKVGSLLKRL